MYCSNCGNEVSDNAYACPKCGCKVAKEPERPKVQDTPNIGFAILGFFIPIAGLILYLIWKDEFPLRAKSAGKGALISVIVRACFFVLYIILYIILVVIIGAVWGGIAASSMLML